MAFDEPRAISTLVKAAEPGSLRKAAGEQGVTPQAASQSLNQPESTSVSVCFIARHGS